MPDRMDAPIAVLGICPHHTCSAAGLPRSEDKPVYHGADYDKMEITQLDFDRMQANQPSPSE